MGLFGENLNWRGGQTKGTAGGKMSIPPGGFLLALALLAIIIMLACL